jgi:sigma-B regulation protein RsbU (phosphoserine phosphatase)
MGRLRSSLRAYALDGGEPGEVLTRLDRQLRHFEPGQMATMLFGVLDPGQGRVHLSSAGHPPAILAAPGVASKPLDTPADPPLGVPAPRPRRTTTVDVPVGGLLCFYTDGLVERRRVPIDDRLAVLCRTLGSGDPTRECASVMSTLVGRTPPADDIALLILKREASGADV